MSTNDFDIGFQIIAFIYARTGEREDPLIFNCHEGAVIQTSKEVIV